MPLVQSACASGNPERMRERERTRARALFFGGVSEISREE